MAPALSSWHATITHVADNMHMLAIRFYMQLSECSAHGQHMQTTYGRMPDDPCSYKNYALLSMMQVQVVQASRQGFCLCLMELARRGCSTSAALYICQFLTASTLLSDALASAGDCLLTVIANIIGGAWSVFQEVTCAPQDSNGRHEYAKKASLQAHLSV